MATSRKVNEEKLDSKTIEHVISLLEGDKPITKKDACSILCISYNTARLAKIIEKYKEDRKREAERRAEKRGKPATKQEEQYVVTAYLVDSASVENIASALYRGSAFVVGILNKYSVPRRNKAFDYFKPALIPDEACKDRFAVGEVVYSANYDSLAKVDSEQPHPLHGYAYRVWLLSDKWKQYAYVPVNELASLQHLKEAGVL